MGERELESAKPVSERRTTIGLKQLTNERSGKGRNINKVIHHNKHGYESGENVRDRKERD